MKRLTAAVVFFILLAPSIALAQGGAPRLKQGFGEQENEMLEFEVVSVDKRQLMVVARDVESGDEFRFRMPARSFNGQEFTVSGEARPGEAISVRGRRDAKLEKLEVEAPLGMTGAGSASGSGDTDRSSPPRRSGESSYKPPRRPGDRSEDPFRTGAPGRRAAGPRGEGGESSYKVESFDAGEWIVTARSSAGAVLELQLNPDAFVGYRFRAPVRDMRRGDGFAMLGLNNEMIAGCCTVLSGGRRR